MNSKQASSGRDRTVCNAHEQADKKPTQSTKHPPMQAEANPQQLAMLTQVVNDFCEEHQIEALCERENAAALIRCLFQRGYETADNLKDALEMAGTIH
jgi:hypothetical protein